MPMIYRCVFNVIGKIKLMLKRYSSMNIRFEAHKNLIALF